MSIIKNIKISLANRALKQELKSDGHVRLPNQFSFEKVKTVGIIFDATNTEDYEIVKRYVVYLREHLKKVKVMGFFSTKEIPALTYSKLEYDFFTTKELNRYSAIKQNQYWIIYTGSSANKIINNYPNIKNHLDKLSTVSQKLLATPELLAHGSNKIEFILSANEFAGLT